MTRYLYGDTTASTLDVDYVVLTKLAVESCVELLLTEWLVRRAREQRDRLTAAADADVQTMEEMKQQLDRALAAAVGDAKPDSRRTRLRDAFARALAQTMQDEVASVRAACGAEVGRLREAEERDASGLVEALDPLLLAYDLPDSQRSLSVRLVEEAYAAELETSAEWGASASVWLEIPAAHPFAVPAQVHDFAPGLEIRASGEGGFLRRGRSLRAHRLHKLIVHEVSIGPRGATVRLRAGTEAGASGYEIAVHPDERVDIESIAADQSLVPLADVGEEDLAKLRRLCETLVEIASELMTSRAAVRRVTLDGVPLQTHEQPTLFVERLVAKIAPIVREIDARSKARGELVLRREIAEGRREETFVSKRTLCDQIERLPRSRRSLFSPLGLEVSMAGDDAQFEDVSLRDLESVERSVERPADPPPDPPEASPPDPSRTP